MLAAALLALGATDAQAHKTIWLCRPGTRANPCVTSGTATSIDAQGARRVVRFPSRGTPPVDCFYVYPTVSNQKTVNATLSIDPEERAVATIQASRFSQVCRVFAPMYRQLTRAAIFGQVGPVTLASRDLALGDLKAAWRDYLRRYNHGRGVVLIGHSQGSFMLVRLIAAEVDPKPSVRRRLISALLPGTAVQVPAGKGVGGSFRHVPACRSFSADRVRGRLLELRPDAARRRDVRPHLRQHRHAIPVREPGGAGRRHGHARAVLPVDARAAGVHALGHLPRALPRATAPRAAARAGCRWMRSTPEGVPWWVTRSGRAGDSTWWT